MTQEKFLNINSLIKDKVYQMKKKNENIDVFLRDVKWLKYTKKKRICEIQNIIEYK